MKKTNFIALALSASLLLVACKPAEISKQEAAKRFENINNAFQAVETIDAVTIKNTIEETKVTDKKSESETSTATLTSNVEKLFTHVSIVEEEKLLVDSYAYVKDNTVYTVDGVKKIYSSYDATNLIDGIKKQINTDTVAELVEQFKDFSDSVAEYLKLTANDFAAALEQTFGKELSLDKNIFNLKFYSSGEGNLLIENSIEYSFNLELAGQKIAQNGKTTGSVEFNDNMPTRLYAETTVNTSGKLGELESTTTQSSKNETVINYTAKVSYPDLSGFTKKDLQ